jgi:hypothetical protein
MFILALIVVGSIGAEPSDEEECAVGLGAEEPFT